MWYCLSPSLIVENTMLKFAALDRLNESGYLQCLLSWIDVLISLQIFFCKLQPICVPSWACAWSGYMKCAVQSFRRASWSLVSDVPSSIKTHLARTASRSATASASFGALSPSFLIFAILTSWRRFSNSRSSSSNSLIVFVLVLVLVFLRWGKRRNGMGKMSCINLDEVGSDGQGERYGLASDD